MTRTTQITWARVALAVLLSAMAGSADAGRVGADDGAPGVSEGVTLLPTFKVGQRREYTLGFGTDWVTHTGDANVASQVRYDALMRCNTIGVNELGGATITVVVSSLTAVVVEGGIRRTITVVEDEDGRASPPATPDAGDVHQATASVVGRVIRVDVNPDGSVATVYGTEPMLAARDAIGIRGRRVFGPFDPDAIGRTLSMIWRIDAPGPDGEPIDRKLGDSWSIESRVSLAYAGDLVTTTQYRLDDLSESVAGIRGDVLHTIEPLKAKPDPAAPKITLSGGPGRVVVQWDVAEGRLVSRLADWTQTVRASIGDLSTVVESSVSLELKAQ